MFNGKEVTTRKKLFKSGKIWVVGTISALALGGIVVTTNEINVHADTTPTTATPSTSSPTSADIENAKSAVSSAQSDVVTASNAASDAAIATSNATSDVNTASTEVAEAQSAVDASGQTGVTQEQKNTDIANATSVVDSAQQDLNNAQSANEAKSNAVSDAQASIDNATSDANSASNAVGDAQATLDSTPATTTVTTTVPGTATVGNGDTLAYVTQNNLWNPAHTESEARAMPYEEFTSGALSKKLVTYTDSQVKSGQAENSGLTQYNDKANDAVFKTDSVVNGQLTDAQAKELNTYLINLVNGYRSDLGLPLITSTEPVFEANKKRAQYVQADTQMEHSTSESESSFATYGLSWSSECLAVVGLSEQNQTNMSTVMNSAANSLESMFNGDAGSNWGHRLALLGESTNVVDGAFYLVRNTSGNFILVFNSAASTVGNSALVDTNKDLGGTSQEVTTEVANPEYTKAQEAVANAKAQLADAQSKLSDARSTLASAQSQQVPSVEDAQAVLDQANIALDAAKSEKVIENTPQLEALTNAKAKLANAQQVLDSAKSNENTTNEVLGTAKATLAKLIALVDATSAPQTPTTPVVEEPTSTEPVVDTPTSSAEPTSTEPAVETPTDTPTTTPVDVPVTTPEETPVVEPQTTPTSTPIVEEEPTSTPIEEVTPSAPEKESTATPVYDVESTQLSNTPSTKSSTNNNDKVVTGILPETKTEAYVPRHMASKDNKTATLPQTSEINEDGLIALGLSGMVLVMGMLGLRKRQH